MKYSDLKPGDKIKIKYEIESTTQFMSHWADWLIRAAQESTEFEVLSQEKDGLSLKCEKKSYAPLYISQRFYVSGEPFESLMYKSNIKKIYRLGDLV